MSHSSGPRGGEACLTCLDHVEVIIRCLDVEVRIDCLTYLDHLKVTRQEDLSPEHLPDLLQVRPAEQVPVEPVGDGGGGLPALLLGAGPQEHAGHTAGGRSAGGADWLPSYRQCSSPTAIAPLLPSRLLF